MDTHTEVKTMTIGELRTAFDGNVTKLGDNHKAIVSFCISMQSMIVSVPYIQGLNGCAEFKRHVRRIRGDAALSAYEITHNITIQEA